MISISGILCDIMESEQCFATLLREEHFERLLEVALDGDRRDSVYALRVVCALVEKFPEHEKWLSPDSKANFDLLMKSSFTDITYSLLLIINRLELSCEPVLEN